MEMMLGQLEICEGIVTSGYTTGSSPYMMHSIFDVSHTVPTAEHKSKLCGTIVTLAGHTSTNCIMSETPSVDCGGVRGSLTRLV